MADLGYYTLPVIPSFRGIEAATQAELNKAMADSGKQAGEEFGKAHDKAYRDEVVKGNKDRVSSDSAVRESWERAGKDAGSAAGKKWLDEFNREIHDPGNIQAAGQLAGILLGRAVAEGVKRVPVARDIIGDLADEIEHGLDTGDWGDLGDQIGKKVGAAIGKGLHDIPFIGETAEKLQEWGTNARDFVEPYADALRKVGDAYQQIQEHDISGALSTTAGALKDIGQGDAASVVDRLSSSFNTFASARDGIKETTSSLSELAVGAPTIAAGLESIGAAASAIAIPLAGLLASIDILSDVTHHAQINPFGHDTDPSHGFNSPIQGPPVVQTPANQMALPGQAPLAAPPKNAPPGVQYQARPGSLDPLQALLPPGVAPPPAATAPPTAPTPGGVPDMSQYIRPDYATGGPISGTGPKGKDSVLFVGAPGEHVFTADEVDAMGGQAAVYDFRRQLHGFAGGGMIPRPESPGGDEGGTNHQIGPFQNRDRGAFIPVLPGGILPGSVDPNTGMPSMGDYGSQLGGGEHFWAPLPRKQGGGAIEEPDWDAIAQGESGGDWHIPSDHQGRPYRGGLQILDSTWHQFGGDAYAPTADRASREQQIDVARRILAGQGPGAWPNTYRLGAGRGGTRAQMAGYGGGAGGGGGMGGIVDPGVSAGNPTMAPGDENTTRQWVQAHFGIPNTFGSGSWENRAHGHDGGWHHRGLGGKDVDSGYAYDFHGTPEQMAALANWVASNDAQNTLELIYGGSGFDRSREIKNGRFGDVYGAGLNAEHTDHVHWARSGPLAGMDGGAGGQMPRGSQGDPVYVYPGQPGGSSPSAGGAGGFGAGGSTFGQLGGIAAQFMQDTFGFGTLLPDFGKWPGVQFGMGLLNSLLGGGGGGGARTARIGSTHAGTGAQPGSDPAAAGLGGGDPADAMASMAQGLLGGLGGGGQGIGGALANLIHPPAPNVDQSTHVAVYGHSTDDVVNGVRKTLLFPPRINTYVPAGE